MVVLLFSFLRLDLFLFPSDISQTPLHQGHSSRFSLGVMRVPASITTTMLQKQILMHFSHPPDLALPSAKAIPFVLPLDSSTAS